MNLISNVTENAVIFPPKSNLLTSTQPPLDTTLAQREVGNSAACLAKQRCLCRVVPDIRLHRHGVRGGGGCLCARGDASCTAAAALLSFLFQTAFKRQMRY